VVLLLALSCCTSNALLIGTAPQGLNTLIRATPTRCCTAITPDDGADMEPSDSAGVAPSDVDPIDGGTPDLRPAPAQDSTLRRSELKEQLLARAAACTRGESANPVDLQAARVLVTELESLNPICEPTLAPECGGTWELVFSDTQLFRSSPFFMAGRAVCADGAEAERYDWFCDMHRAALAISTIGKVRQVVSSSRIISEFEVSVGAVPFLSDVLPFVTYSGGLPLTVTGSIVSTATIEGNLGDAWRLLMDTVEIKGSNIPGVRQALDNGLRLQSRDVGGALEAVVPTYANPQPLFRTSYLDGQLRISRDQDGKLFVYSKLSDATEPTDYSDEPFDLGVTSLLQGLSSTLLG